MRRLHTIPGPPQTAQPADRTAPGRPARPGARRVLASRAGRSLWPDAPPVSGSIAGRLVAVCAVRRSALGLALVATAACTAAAIAPAARADDRIATDWQIQAGTAPLLQAPKPANPATICIIDTGVNATPDLTITARRSLLGGTLDDIRALPGQTGHGTAVAHFAAGAVNGWGGAGAFPHARITSVRVFPQDGGGARWQDYVRALDHCVHADVQTKVVLIALGGRNIEPGAAAELENRIVVARRDAGTNVVVAAGNGGSATDFPGRFPASFTVAAVDRTSQTCGFSARGVGVDIAAPGCDLAQSAWDGSMWSMDGTSFAAPIVAGALAAVRSYHPDLSPGEAEQLLLDTARAGSVPVLDATAALRSARLGHLVDSYIPFSAQSPEHVEPLATPGFAATPAFGAASPPPKSPRVAAVGRLTKPRLRLRRLGHHRVSLYVANRPPGALLEVSVDGRRRVLRASSGVRLRTHRARALRARFVSEITASAWVKKTIPDH